VTIPAGRSAWVQSNYLMDSCSVIRPRQTLIVNRTITLAYRAAGNSGSQQIATPSARLILTR
jgi:hypothetical protein